MTFPFRLAGETGSFRIEKPASSGGLFGFFVRYVRQRAHENRARELPVLVVVLRVVEANIAPRQ